MTSEIKLGTLVSLHNVKVNPKDFDEIVEHYSIPAWNSLESELVQSSDIESSKILLPDEEHILVSCLNPSTHKVWRVGKNNSKVKRLASTEWAVVIPHNTKEIDFINSALEGFHFQFQMNAYVTGTTNSHQRVKKPDFLHLTIPHPKKNIRDKTGNLHSRLRRKSVTNKRITEYCSDYISYLFRSWFIDFDPVKAKAEGKLPYGMDEETSALFTDSFEDSELGSIPSGWNVGRIGNIADISSGKHQPERSELESSEYCTPLLGGAGIIAWTTESLFDEPIIVIGRVGTLGVVKKYTSPVWPSDNTLIFKTHHNSSFHYLLHQLRLQDFGAYNRGSTQPLLTQHDMRKLKLLIPNEDILMAFEEKIRSMTLLSDTIEGQSEYLTQTRDALLPRLMSGELKVN